MTYIIQDCPDDTALGSAGAQEGATEAGSSEGGSFSPMLMYGLIAAVAVAVLLALIGKTIYRQYNRKMF